MTNSNVDQLPKTTVCKYADLADSDYQTAINPVAETESDIKYMCAFADDQLTTETMNFAHLARLAMAGLKAEKAEKKRIIEATSFDGVMLNIIMVFNGMERTTEISLSAADAIYLYESGYKTDIRDGECISITMQAPACQSLLVR